MPRRYMGRASASFAVMRHSLVENQHVACGSLKVHPTVLTFIGEEAVRLWWLHVLQMFGSWKLRPRDLAGRVS